MTDGWEGAADSRTRKRKPDLCPEGVEDDFIGRVVVDMREFRSKLPSLLFQVPRCLVCVRVKSPVCFSLPRPAGEL